MEIQIDQAPKFFKIIDKHIKSIVKAPSYWKKIYANFTIKNIILRVQ